MQASDEEYRVIWLVRRLFRALAAKSDELLEDLGISAADRAVMEFLYPDVTLSVPEIASRYLVSRQHVQVTVNRLLDAGLLETGVNPRHKRSPLMTLSGSGKRLFRSVRRREAKAVGQLFLNIPTKDKHATHNTLETLLARLEEV